MNSNATTAALCCECSCRLHNRRGFCWGFYQHYQITLTCLTTETPKHRRWSTRRRGSGHIIVRDLCYSSTMKSFAALFALTFAQRMCLYDQAHIGSVLSNRRLDRSVERRTIMVKFSNVNWMMRSAEGGLRSEVHVDCIWINVYCKWWYIDVYHICGIWIRWGKSGGGGGNKTSRLLVSVPTRLRWARAELHYLDIEVPASGDVTVMKVDDCSCCIFQQSVRHMKHKPLPGY